MSMASLSKPSRPSFAASRDARTANAQPGREAADRRVADREPAHDLSEIWVAGSKVAITCLVRNLSPAGALIEAGLAQVPDRFILTNHSKNCRMVCQVVRRDGRLTGIRFVTPPRKLFRKDPVPNS
jgi:hypothetical protein